VTGLVGPISSRSASGSQTIEAQSSEVEARTVSGSLTLSGSAKKLEAETVSGDVHWHGTTESLKASSVSGRMMIEELGAPPHVSLRTVSGSMHIAGFGAGTEAEVRTTSGEVVLSLRAGAPVDVTASTMSGDLRGFGSQPEPTSFGPKRQAHFNNAGNGASVRIHTLSGDVELRTT
jgi:DUF4097 and DUF4098 domain-containing protein YvlB